MRLSGRFISSIASQSRTKMPLKMITQEKIVYLSIVAAPFRKKGNEKAPLKRTPNWIKSRTFSVVFFFIGCGGGERSDEYINVLTLGARERELNNVIHSIRKIFGDLDIDVMN